NRTKGVVERVTNAIQPLPVVFAADCKRDRPGRKIKQVAINCEITQRQFKRAGILQSDIHSRPGRPALVAKEDYERIKCRGRISIQQRVTQTRLADVANRQVLPLISVVAETHFPVPSLEMIGDPTQLTAQPDVKEVIHISELFVSRTGIVNAAILHVLSDR